MKCRICNNLINNHIYEVSELMFGYRDKFKYFQCSKCKCLQIAEIPTDISKYYPPNYYSFTSDPFKKYENPLKKNRVKFRDYYTVLGKGIFATAVKILYSRNRYKILSNLSLTRDSRILDVGCGSGWYLYGLREIGFNNILGIDPYIKNDIIYKNGLKILKTAIHDLRAEWELIMYNHSFEHLHDPLENLHVVSKLLSKGGTCLIRIPTVSSYAWEHYREHWVSLDAPRHYFLHSVESMEILAKKSGLYLKDIIYESTEFQFVGSEQYLRGASLVSDRAKSMFTKSQKKKWRREAQKLNAEGRGDHAAFFLSRE